MPFLSASKPSVFNDIERMQGRPGDKASNDESRRKRPQRTNAHAAGVDVAAGSVSVDVDVEPIGQPGTSAQAERITPHPR